LKSYTVAREVELTGRGLFSGEDCSAVIAPADAGTGLVFIRDGTRIPATPAQFTEAPNCTVLGCDGQTVMVTEHLMAALWAAGIDTAAITVDGPELPNRDGSARWQYEKIAEAGRHAVGERPGLKLDHSVTVGDPGAFIIWTPHDTLEITYFFSHAELGEQVVIAEIDRKLAADAILPSRSFITESEAQDAIAKGFLKNTHAEDALVITNGRPNSPLRFPDEYARHKVLDLLGDLNNVPAELTGRIAAFRSGHRLNRELALELFRRIS
jgi:UDP-3-O-[3-hydroxymyristoyl] N-acetylglucosamine deacetylase